MSKYTGNSAAVASVAMTIGDGGKKGLTGKVARDVELIPIREPVEEISTGLSRVRKEFKTNMENFLGPFVQEEFDGRRGYTGWQSIGAPGAGSNPKVIKPGYPVRGKVQAQIGRFGTPVTSCGELPGRILNDLIQSNPGEYGFSPNEVLQGGPQGSFVQAKYMRAYIPSSSGQKPKPGDIYWLAAGPGNQRNLPEEGTVVHVGLIYEIYETSDPDVIIWRTAEAGWGPTDEQKSVWVKHNYNIRTRRLDGSAGDGADAAGPSNKKLGSLVKGWMDIDKFISNAASKLYPKTWTVKAPVSGPVYRHSTVLKEGSEYQNDETFIEIS